ncbi:hypothetical protein AYO38_01495 [bacterium SCGC AG-212-C10]|nr:hypothetical protein AYO38_01495 [bacterium SCGC AG-212-C10]
MKARLLILSMILTALFVPFAAVSSAEGPGGGTVSPAAAVGTGFTYQGRLEQGGIPADGTYDFRFALFDAPEAGVQTGLTLVREDVAVVDGLFTVTLDFTAVFGSGVALFLEVGVRPGDSAGDFELLTPRQALTPTPYSLYSASSWNLSGNSGTFAGTNFVGTKDASPLVFRTNNVEAMRINSSGQIGIGTQTPNSNLDVVASNIGILSTSTSRAIIGRLAAISCPGTFAVGGCAGASGGTGVVGSSDSGLGVSGSSSTSRAVQGFSGTGIGVIGDSSTRGVVGTLGRTSCSGTFGVGGCATDNDGVLSRSTNGVALRAETTGGTIFIGSAANDVKVRIDATGRGFFDNGTQTGGADFAESIRAADSGQLQPGDVLEIDPSVGYGVRKSSTANSRLLAGVYSTRPSVLAVGTHGVGDSLEGEAPVAMLGVVPTKVSAENGPIAIGDLLVTSSTPGHAMKAVPEYVGGVAIYPTGAILGKALEPLTGETGVILVMVTLR